MGYPLKATTIERISAAQASTLPLRSDAEIRNIEVAIKGTVFMRDFHYGRGDMAGARLHAIRLGTLRGQLRQLKAGK
jgi:hypothetical protein